MLIHSKLLNFMKLSLLTDELAVGNVSLLEAKHHR